MGYGTRNVLPMHHVGSLVALDKVSVSPCLNRTDEILVRKPSLLGLFGFGGFSDANDHRHQELTFFFCSNTAAQCSRSRIPDVGPYCIVVVYSFSFFSGVSVFCPPLVMT